MLTLNIQGFEKADVLVALYHAAKPAHAQDVSILTKAAAQLLIDAQPDLKFDTINGRAIDADISSDHLDFSAFIKANELNTVNSVLQELAGKRSFTAQLTPRDTAPRKRTTLPTVNDLEIGGGRSYL